MTRTKKLKPWKRKIVDIIANETGCRVQYNRCPCNTCFHTWACEELGDVIGHAFWQVVLVIRGDYTEKQIIEYNKENDKNHYTKTLLSI